MWIDDLEPHESDEMLQVLRSHITQDRFQYRHTCAEGDVLLWDNFVVQHRCRPVGTWQARPAQ